MSLGTKLCRPLMSSKFVFSCPSIRMMSDTMSYNCKALNVIQAAPNVFHVELNRPTKMNALNNVMWEEIGEVFTKLDRDQECRAVVLSAAGKMFCSGIDLADLTKLASIVYSEDDIARKALTMYQTVKHLQDLFTTIEKCKKPVISCVHNACVGGGIDLITTTDIRMCTTDAWFSVKEVDMGLAADVGTLQRLPKVIGSQSLVNDLCLTARRMKSEEAEKCGLVSSVFHTKEEMMTAAIDMPA
jgi:delta(3,5)-delta(2,4)-dienoyl-CoA isomerase